LAAERPQVFAWASYVTPGDRKGTPSPIYALLCDHFQRHSAPPLERNVDRACCHAYESARRKVQWPFPCP
jgi:hypothetical protein